MKVPLPPSKCFYLVILLLTQALFAQAQTNDDPCNAVALTVGNTCNGSGTNATNAGATATRNVPAPSCTAFNPTNDVWFKFTLSAPSSVRVTTAAGTMTDGLMQLFAASSCSSAFRELGCNDDATEDNLMPEITLSTLAAGTYYVRVSSVSTTGTFNICVTATDPITSEFAVCDSIVVGLASTTITYTGKVSSTARYYWVFDGGLATPGTGPGPQRVNWPSTGIKTVALTVEDNGVRSVTTTRRVNVVATPPLPTAQVLIGDTSVCTGQPLDIPFRLTGKGPWTVSYTETSGGSSVSKSQTLGNATSCNPSTFALTVTPAVATRYAITGIQDANFTAQVFSAVNVAVSADQAPASTFTASKPTLDLSDNTVITYTGNAGSSAVFNWNFDGGEATPGTGAGPHTVRWSSTGVKNVTLTVRQGACQSTTTVLPVTITSNGVGNDDPCNATLVAVANNCTYISGTTAGATASGGIVPPACAAGTVAGDVWYKLVVADISDVAVATQAGTLTDAALQVFGSDGCTNLTAQALACDDNSIGFMPVVALKALPKGTYYVRVWGKAQQSGTFNLCVKTTPVAPPTAAFTAGTASVCAGDTAKLNILLTGTGPWTVYYTRTAGEVSTPDSLAIGNGFSITPFLYRANAAPVVNTTYAITGVKDNYFNKLPANSTTTLEVKSSLSNNTFSTNVTFANTGQDVTVTYTGTGGSGDSYAWDFDGGTVVSGTGAGPYLVRWLTPGARNIRLTLASNGCSSVSSQSITVSGSNLIDAPCDALPLSVGASFANPSITAYSNLGATATDVGVSGCGGGTQHDVWFKFTTTAPQDLVITTAAGTLTDGLMQVLSAPACGGPFTELACEDDSQEGTMPQAQLNDLPAGTYYIRFWGYSGSTGTFGINVNSASAVVPTAAFASQYNSICQGETVMLPINLTGSGPWNISYEEKPDGGNAVTKNVVAGDANSKRFTYNLPVSPIRTTTYTLQQVSDANYTTPQPVSGSTSVAVSAKVAPTSGFAVSDSVVAAGQTITLQYSGNADITAGDVFQWDFDGGTASPGTGQGPHTVTWNEPGVRNVSLVVTNGSCPTALTVKRITVVIANDAPCNALNLPVSPSSCLTPAILYNNSGATATDAGAPSCGGGTQHDVWFKFTTTAQQDLVITTAAGTLTDGLMQVLAASACGGPFTELACEDDSPGSRMPQAQLDDLPAGTYYIRFWGDNGQTGTFGICLSPITPPTVQLVSGDQVVCRGSEAVLNLQVTGRGPWKVHYTEQTYASFADKNIEFGADETGPYGYSFEVRPTESTYYYITGISDANFTTIQAVNDSALIAVNEQAAPTSTFTTSSEGATTGQDVTVTYTGTGGSGDGYAWDFDGGTVVSGTGAGPYVVRWLTPGAKNITLVVTGSACSSAATSKAVNITGSNLFDTPCTALNLPVNPSSCLTPAILYNNAGATAADVGMPDCGGGTPNDVWFKFTTTARQDLIITTAAGTLADGLMQVLAASACGGPFTELACEDDSQEGTMPQTQLNNLPAGTYYIRFWGNDGQTGTFGICLSPIASPTVTFLTADSTVCAGQPHNLRVSLTGIGPWRVYYSQTDGAGTVSKSILLGNANSVSPAVFSIPVSITQATRITLTGIADTRFTAVRGATGSNVLTPVTGLSSAFSASSSATQTGAAVTFTLSGPAAAHTSYSWYFDGGTPHTATGPGPHRVTWTAPGTRNVTLSVTRAGCVTSETVQTVTINGANLLDNPCQAASLTANAAEAWFANTGAAPTANALEPSCARVPALNDVWFTFTTASELDVELLTRAGSLSDGAMQLLAATGCTDPYQEIKCSDANLEEETSMPAISINSLAAGTYYVRFWSSTSAVGTFGISLKTSRPGQPTARFETRSDTICQTGPAALDVRLTGKGPWTMSYNSTQNQAIQTLTIGDNTSRGPFNHSIPVTLASNVSYVIGSISDANFPTPVTDGDTTTIVVGAVPAIQPVISGPTQSCTSIAKYYVPKADGVQQVWGVSGGGNLLSKGDTATVKWWGRGAFTLTVTPANACGTGPAGTLSVNLASDSQKPTITLANGQLVSSAPTGNQWFYNGTLVEGATAQSIIASTPGDYTVQTVNGCGKSTTSDVFTLAVTGLNEKLQHTIKVYPNPARQYVHVELGAETQWEYVSLVNLHGVELLRTNHHATRKVSMNVQQVPKGLYLLLVRTNTGYSYYRVLVL